MYGIAHRLELIYTSEQLCGDLGMGGISCSPLPLVSTFSSPDEMNSYPGSLQMAHPGCMDSLDPWGGGRIEFY